MTQEQALDLLVEIQRRLASGEIINERKRKQITAQLADIIKALRGT